MKLLSRAGRLTLIKYVLDNLPIYYLGHFKMPKQVVRKIISIQSRFFWGMKDRGSIIQKPKRLGGLGVSGIVLKNASLLFKKWWHFATDNSPLWKQIVCSCHNLDGSKPVMEQSVGKSGGL